MSQESRDPNKPETWYKPAMEIMGVVAILSLIVGVIGLLISFHRIGPDRAYGNCSLKPVHPANIQTVVARLQHGLHYDAMGNYSLAEREFKELLAIDPNFIGANLDLGYAYLEQGDIDKAENSFMKEQKSIECLTTVSDRYLPQFAYMLSGDNENLSRVFTSRQKSIAFRKRLRSIEDATHYDLACLRLRQHDPDGAKWELKQAVANCSIPSNTFQKDRELAPLRQNEQEFLSLIKCPSGSRQQN